MRAIVTCPSCTWVLVISMQSKHQNLEDIYYIHIYIYTISSDWQPLSTSSHQIVFANLQIPQIIDIEKKDSISTRFFTKEKRRGKVHHWSQIKSKTLGTAFEPIAVDAFVETTLEIRFVLMPFWLMGSMAMLPTCHKKEQLEQQHDRSFGKECPFWESFHARPSEFHSVCNLR